TAGIGRVQSGEDLHQRRLAGTVLAAHAEHLAGMKVEGDVVESLDTGEGLGDRPDLEQGGVGVAGTAGSVVLAVGLHRSHLLRCWRAGRSRSARPDRGRSVHVSAHNVTTTDGS